MKAFVVYADYEVVMSGGTNFQYALAAEVGEKVPDNVMVLALCTLESGTVYLHNLDRLLRDAQNTSLKTFVHNVVRRHMGVGLEFEIRGFTYTAEKDKDSLATKM